MTKSLLDFPHELHLFEIDRRFKGILTDLASERSNVVYHWGDVLKLESELFPKTNQFVVCGNLPYYCGTAILQRFIDLATPPRQIVFLLQREVAQKAAAKPGGKEYGYLSVKVQLFSQVSLGKTFSPECFRPSPKVFSTILEAIPLELSTEERKSRKNAEAISSLLFTHRRKMALPILRKNFPDRIPQIESFFSRQNLGEKIRPQEISPDQFLLLAKTIHS